MKKRSLTLLEVMIAMSLAAVLLGFLFQLFFRLSQANIVLEKGKERLLSRQAMHQRLSIAMSKTVKAEKSDEPSLFTLRESIDGSTALAWKVAQPIDRDPAFSGNQMHLLYCHKPQGLCLSTWSRDQTERRDEVLLGGVESIALQFFEDENGEWQEGWISKDKRPEMVKLIVKEKEHPPETFVYFLP